MAAVQIFLSTVTAEFKAYRAYLLSKLTLPGVAVKTQEDFIDRGDVTLEKLDRYIQACDAVIHVVGDGVGALANGPSQRWLRNTLTNFPDRVPELAAEWAAGTLAGSYTQWEAWLAIYHRKRLFIARAAAGAEREVGFSASSGDAALQAEHLGRLRRAGRYPAVEFSDAKDLAVELLRSLQDILPPLQAGPAKPCTLPPAAGHFVGRKEQAQELTRRLAAGESATVVGMAGMGKTALAAEVLRPLVGQHGERLYQAPWPDGVLMLDLYALRGMADPAWHELANQAQSHAFLPDRAAEERAREALRRRRLLIVVEGAEQADGQAARCTLPALQRVADSTCRWLVLTRDDRQAPPSQRVPLNGRLRDGEDAQLLDALMGSQEGPPLPDELQQAVLGLLQGHPLAITWAGSLLAGRYDSPYDLVRDWQAQALPPLSQPGEERHTLDWLFGRSVSRLSDTARSLLAVAGCLAPTPVPLSAFDAAMIAWRTPGASGPSPLPAVRLSLWQRARQWYHSLGRLSADTPVVPAPSAAMALSERDLRIALASLVQHSLLRLSDDGTSWQFAHVLAYGHARGRLPAPPSVPPALAEWVMQTLWPHLGRDDGPLDPSGVAAGFEHAAALLKADRHRQLWWSLLNPLLYDLHDRLVALGWSALVEADLAAVAQGFDSLAADAAAESDVQRERSVLSNRVADLALLRGDLAGAERAYRSALAVRERLAQADPSNAQWQRDLSVSQNKIGEVLSAQGDLAGAERAYRASLAVRERLAQADPSNAEWQRDLSISQDNIGQVLSAQGDLAGAEKAYRASLAVAERLAQADPSNADWQRDLSVSQNKIGEVLSAQGDLAGAEKAYRLSLAVSERLAQADPSNAQWQRDLSVSQEKIGEVLSAQGDLAGAEKAYRSALVVRERLAQADPSNAQWQRDLSISQNKIGEVLSAQGDLAGAEKAYRSALAVSERLAQADPSNAQWQSDLGEAHECLGNVSAARSDWQAAAVQLQMALDIYDQLVSIDPRNTEFAFCLSRCLRRIATMREQQGQWNKAVPSARRSLDLISRLLELAPNHQGWKDAFSASRALLDRLESRMPKC